MYSFSAEYNQEMENISEKYFVQICLENEISIPKTSL